MSQLVSQVTELVQRTIHESTGMELTLEADTPLIESGYLDSLTLLQVIAELQDTFEVDLDVSEVTEEAFETPSAIAELVGSLQ